MDLGGLAGKLGESSDGVASVGACCHIGIEKLAKKFTISEAHGILEKGVFLGMFEVTNGGIEGVDVRRRKRFGRARASKTFSGSWSIPTMGCKETLEVGSTVNLDIGDGLFKVDAVESGGQTKVFKRGVSFTRKLEFGANGSVDGIGNRGRRASNGKVINLLTEKNRLRAKLVQNVNVAFVCGVLEVKFRQSEDGVDVVLP